MLFPCQRRFLADKVLVGGDCPAQAALVGTQVLEILLQGEAFLHGNGTDVNLQRLKLPAAHGLHRFQRQIVNFRALVEGGVNFIAVFSGEAGTVDVDGNVSQSALTDAEALEIVHRLIQHGIHGLEAVRPLHGVHVPVVGDDLRLNVRVALVLFNPGEQPGAIQVGDPIQALRHVHDDHVVDDLAVFIQGSGVLRAPDGDLGNVADVDFLQNLQRVLAGDLHQIVGPAVEAYALADGLGVGACDLIFSE